MTHHATLRDQAYPAGLRIAGVTLSPSSHLTAPTTAVPLAADPRGPDVRVPLPRPPTTGAHERTTDQRG